MKIFRNLLLLMLLVSMAVVSCRKPVEEEIEEPVSNNTNANGLAFTAKVDNVAWTATTASIKFDNGVITILASNAKGETMGFSIMKDIKGQYALGIGKTHSATYKPVGTTAATTTYSTLEGANTNGLFDLIEIDTVAKTFTAEFNFVAGTSKDNTKKTVTNGKITKLKYEGTIYKAAANKVTANVNSVYWAASNFSVPAITSGKIQVLGEKGDGTKIAIFVPEGVTPGTYPLSASSNTYSALYLDPNANLSTISGNIVVSEHNEVTKFISGTFEFEAVDAGDSTKNKSVKNGVFQATYQ